MSWLAKGSSDHPAIICPRAGTWSYSRLRSQVSAFSQLLARHQVRENDRVILCANKSAFYLAGILAILSRGATYVPIYEKSPIERAISIVTDCGASIALVDDQGEQILKNHICCIHLKEQENTQAVADSNPHTDSLAYLLYTSGSTGQPKGVMVSNVSLEHYARWAGDFFQMNSQSVVLNTAPFYFDMSVFDIFATFLTGGTLVIATEKDCMFPKLLLNLIKNNAVTHWKGVSSSVAIPCPGKRSIYR